MISLQTNDALIVVDVQNDFIPGGALAVNFGDKIVEPINNLLENFPGRVVFTQDWHPAGHRSFASAHADKKPFDPYEEEGIGPVLWPDHCIQGTKGAEFHPKLKVDAAHLIIRKGYNPQIDSYSAMHENDKKTQTGLVGYLKNAGVHRIFVCGLAFDYCVGYTALDASTSLFEVYVLEDLTKGIAVESIDAMRKQLTAHKVGIINSSELIQ